MQVLRKAALAALILCACGGAAARTVLEYTSQELDLARYRELPVPQSVFHSWELANADADRIVAAWAKEPVTIPWTRLELTCHVKHKISPTRAARGLALMHVAMYDAYDLAAQQGVDVRLAVSMAAAQALGYLFVPEEKAFDRVAFAIAARLTGAPVDHLPDDALRAMYLGYAVGRHVAQYGDTDGAQKGWNGVRLQWYGEGRYYGPGTWEPTPPYFYFPPDEPFAPSWRTWVLATPGEFRPTPPEYGSPRFIKDLQELVDINEKLTPEQLAIAKKWVDGHGSITPPGHWNQIAMASSIQAKLDDRNTAQLFLQLNIAEADAFVATWDAKYHYWTARPITAAKNLLGKDLKLPILTPPFPSYVSGHATFSGAAARILGVYFPAERASLEAQAEEAATSRLYGGIHYRHDNEDGLKLGQQVADKVLEHFAFRQKDD